MTPLSSLAARWEWEPCALTWGAIQMSICVLDVQWKLDLYSHACL